MSNTPSAINRFRAALEAGAETLFRDKALLRELARLKIKDPGEYAVCRAAAATAEVSLKDLERSVAPHRREILAARPPADVAGQYRVSGGRIVRVHQKEDAEIEIPLCNFTARIIEQVVVDDGVEGRTIFAISGELQNGIPLPRVEVESKDFPWMRWTTERWGTHAVVMAGMGTADHLRVAIQLLSGEVSTRTVYAHLGWREVAGHWIYLHAAGAIGHEGAVNGIDVVLPDALARYELPAPPSGAKLVQAVRASLALLDLAPKRITVPVFAIIFRAVLGDTDFTVNLIGKTGLFKTELATLAQQHFGPGMDARNLPGSWSSTGNSLETLAFHAKDAILTVDDFAPGGNTGDQARMHREAERLLRAQGNRSARQRMRSDGSLRPAKSPRGLILSTGEELPRSQSIRARNLVVEVGKDEINVARLTACQRDAGAGLYAACLAGYVRWLASRYNEIRARLPQERADLRDKARTDGVHARTPSIVADLTLGFRYFLDFAVEAGAVTVAERDDLAQVCWATLVEAARGQTQHVNAADPTGQFLRLLCTAIASGRAHLADRSGGVPVSSPGAWGWRNVAAGTGDPQRDDWRAQGRCVGWLDGPDLYLEPEAAFAEAQELAQHQGDSLAFSTLTLRKRLKEGGLLASTGAQAGRESLTVRRMIEGTRREVLHIKVASLPSLPPDLPDQTTKKTGK